MAKIKALLKKTTNGIVLKNISGYFLITCLILTGLLLFTVLKPFIFILIFGAILSTVFYPIYLKILKSFKGNQKGAAFVTCFLVLTLIVLPLILFLVLLGRQAYDAFLNIKMHLQDGFWDNYIKWERGGVIYDFVDTLRFHLGPYFNINDLDLKKNIVETAQSVSTFIVAQIGTFLRGFGFLIFGSFLMFFAMYYYFKDANKIIKKLRVLSPLPDKYENELFGKFKEISLATLYGILLTSIVQGIIGGIGFAIAGVSNPLFWGTAISVFSIVPFIGTATIWLPASIILLISGNVFGGIFLFFWGLLLVGTVDNFLRAYLIGEKTKSNQLLTFLSVFGGLLTFGIIGIILGPLIMNLFFVFVHIYEQEYEGKI